MKASLLTDKFQGWIVILLMALVTIAFSTNIQFDPNSPRVDLITPTGMGWETFYTLTAANLAANIFHQGYWQRVYSAKDDRELRKSCFLAAFMSFPVMFLIGFTGMIAVWMEVSERNDSLAFFHVMATLPVWANGVVLMLATAFISSSVDTLQNGIVATVVNDVCLNKVSLNIARVITAVLNIPIILIAVKGYDVLSLFLIADLAAAVIVLPVLIGLVFGSVKLMRDDVLERQDPLKTIELKTAHMTAIDFKNTTTSIHLPNGLDFCVGVFGGVFSIVLFGTLFNGGDVIKGVQLLGLPNGMSVPGESMGAFLSAPVGSVAFMLGFWILRRIVFSGHVEKESKVTLFHGSLVLE